MCLAKVCSRLSPKMSHMVAARSTPITITATIDITATTTAFLSSRSRYAALRPTRIALAPLDADQRSESVESENARPDRSNASETNAFTKSLSASGTSAVRKV